MRISTGYQYDSLLFQIENSQSNLSQYQEEISTGKQINTVSDNPVGASQMMSMSTVQAGLTQYTANLNHAKAFISLSDNALSTISGLATQAYQLSVQAANSTTDQAGRDGMVQQINQIESQLVNSANSSLSNGVYLFGGHITNHLPYKVTSAGLTYNGDSQPQTVELAPGQTLSMSSNANTHIQQLYSNLESLKANLQSGNVSAISGTDIANLQQSIQNFSMDRGVIGSALQTVNNTLTDYQRRSTDISSSISQISDVNIADAITKYQTAQTAYQGALTVMSQVSNLSLLSFLQ